MESPYRPPPGQVGTPEKAEDSGEESYHDPDPYLFLWAQRDRLYHDRETWPTSCHDQQQVDLMRQDV